MQVDDDIPPEQHALVSSSIGAGNRRIHPLPFSEPSRPGNFLCSLILWFINIYHSFLSNLEKVKARNICVINYQPTFVVQPRSMDPSKDLAAYGYGSVAWKERMQSWKQKQDKLQMMNNQNTNDWDNDGDGLDLSL